MICGLNKQTDRTKTVDHAGTIPWLMTMSFVFYKTAEIMALSGKKLWGFKRNSILVRDKTCSLSSAYRNSVSFVCLSFSLKLPIQFSITVTTKT